MLQSIYGCDSIVTLHLVINHSVHDTISRTARNSYTWNGHTYTESGRYTFQGSTIQGCDSVVTLVLTIEQDVDIPDAATTESLIVYPNPTAGNITISADEVVKVEVFDFLGRMAAQYSGTNRIDLSSLPSGSYTLRVTLPQGTAIRRVVKK